MDFAMTPEQQTLREEIVRFAQKELNHDLIARDREQVFSRDLWKQCGALGLQGMPVPEEYGGSAADGLTTAIAMEALGYGCKDSGLVFSICAHLLSCVVPLWKHGSEAQKRRWLPGLCDGTLVGVHAMTEPDSGSDAFTMHTKATADGDGWRLNGTKIFITNGPVADMVIVFAMTDVEKGFHGGITAFLVEAGAPGFRISQKIEKMGLRTSPFAELSFENVYVGPETILGKPGAGAQQFQNSMDWERVCLFASHVGTMERLTEQSIEYARTRRQFNQPVGKFQAIQHKVADMKIRLEASRLLVRRAAAMLDKSKMVSLDAAVAKVFVSEALVQTSLDAVQIHGGYGYCTEYEIERAVRDAVGSTIYSGTSELQRQIIARFVGL
ncbi:MAG TPA: acyl-CoA dehydrogenase family protein [Gemmatimonadaceae bacterium]|nr:acyl-CoA dehydrogenase family protein [Gemmatimonadaceae bacterium]